MQLLLPAVLGGQCEQPKGQEGERVASGCITQTCKAGVWRPSLDKTVCCFNGEPFQFGSRITTVNSSDNCTTTTLECEEDGVKTRIDQNRGKAGCSGPASTKEIREMKCMLKEHMEKSGFDGCLDKSRQQSESSSTSSAEHVSGILIAGGKAPGSETTELFIVETGQTCSLPSLPSPRIDHSLDVMNSMPVLCGDSFENDVGQKSCLKFSPLSDCGSWRNFTTLQYDLGYSGHNSWTTQHGLLLMSRDFELLPFSDQSQVIEFVDYKTRGNASAGRGVCGFEDGDTFVLTGNMRFNMKSVRRFSFEMVDGFCNQEMFTTHYERCKRVKGAVETLPDLQLRREFHGCGIYRDANNAKVYLVAGGRDDKLDELFSTEILIEGATSWAFTSPLHRAFYTPASVSLDNRVFFIGGEFWENYKKHVSEEIVEFDGDDWKVVGHLQTPRIDHAATKIDASSLMGFC